MGGGGLMRIKHFPAINTRLFSGFFFYLFYSIKHIKHYECRFQLYSPLVIPCRF